MSRRRFGGDAGSATALFGVGLAFVGMLAVVAVDASAYLLAASRAQSLADGSALAAAIALNDGRNPQTAAERVATAGAGRLVECLCVSLPVDVAVDVEVNGLVVPTLTARRVTARSEATVVPP